METEERRQRGRHSPSDGRLCVETDSRGERTVRSIGEGARLTVREDRAGPRFISWEPFPRRVKALASRKAKRAARVATAKANQPNVGPGAAAATEFLSAPMLAPSRPKRASAAGRTIWEAIQSLVAKGYIRDSGQRRNGQIVWVATDKQPHPLEWREPEGSA